MEEWKIINGFDGRYSISNKGRIKQNNIDYISLQNKHIHHDEKILEPILWQSRYLRIDLRNNKKDKKYRLNVYIHKLVAEYFIGPRLKGYEIEHIDSNYLNNSADNLRYVSHKDNMNNSITKDRRKEVMKNYWNNISYERRKEIGYNIKIGLNNGGNEKISKANKGRIPVYNDTDYRRVKPEELDKYINNGYKRGLPKWITTKLMMNT